MFDLLLQRKVKNHALIGAQGFSYLATNISLKVVDICLERLITMFIKAWYRQIPMLEYHPILLRLPKG